MIKIGSEGVRYMVEKYLEEQGIDFSEIRIYAVKDFGGEPILAPQLEVFFDEN